MAWRLCKIRPDEVLKMTLGDLDIVLGEGLAEFEDDIKRYVDIKVSIMNAPHFHKNNDKPYTNDEFLSPKHVKEMTEEEKSKRWLAAGNACMDTVEQHRKMMRGKRNGSTR